MSELKPKKLKFGIVCSTAGGTIFAAVEIFNSVYPDSIEIVVATDRECGIEPICQERGIQYQRFSDPDKNNLSSTIAAFFKKQDNITAVLLYFVRLISRDLYGQFPTLNIHPSLLPAFPGFNAVERALESDVKFLGATLHLVDETVDCGPFIAQNVHPLQDISIEEAYRLSFAQKVYLTLLLFEMMAFEKIEFGIKNTEEFLHYFTESMACGKTENPSLTGADLKMAFKRFLEKECLSIYKA